MAGDSFSETLRSFRQDQNDPPHSRFDALLMKTFIAGIPRRAEHLESQGDIRSPWNSAFRWDWQWNCF